MVKEKVEKLISRAPRPIRFLIAIPILVFAFLFFGIGATIEGFAECLDKIFG